MTKLLLENGSDRHHRKRLTKMLQSTTGTIRIASAYVTDKKLAQEAKDVEAYSVPSRIYRAHTFNGIKDSNLEFLHMELMTHFALDN